MSAYLDYQASTPLAPEALGAMQPWLDTGFANPHAVHKAGRAAAAAIEVAREQIGALLPRGGQLYFTSGATEALNWALRCTARGPIRFAETEHAAVRDTALWLGEQGRSVDQLAVDGEGLLSPDLAVADGTGIVAVMLVNNEIGVIQPVEAIAEQAHRAGALLLCDAVQGFGRVALPDNADLIALSAHKIHGPKGIGALWVRDGVAITPLLHGGGQERGLRSGTLSPALCAGFGAAAAVAQARRDADATHIEALWQMAVAMLPPGWQINGSTKVRYRGNLSLRCAGLDVARLISELRDIAFAAGSACASGSGRPSHVLRAIGLTDSQARSSLRLGFGRYTSADELHAALSAIFAAAHVQGSFAA